MAAHRHSNAGPDRGKLWIAASDPRLELQSMVRDLIIPRLLGTYANAPPRDRRPKSRTLAQREREAGQIGSQCQGSSVASSDLGQFKAALLANDLGSARRIADSLLSRNVSVNEVLQNLIGAAAIDIGEMWTEADCSLVDVTLGLGVLQVVMRDVVSKQPLARRPADMPSIRLFAVLPEQHTLGNLVVGEVFRSQGWSVAAEQPPSLDDVLQEVSTDWFHVIGLSVSCERHLPELAQAARRLRRASVNPSVIVVAGGRAISGASAREIDALGLDRVLREASRAEDFANALADDVAAQEDGKLVLQAEEKFPFGPNASIGQSGSPVAAPEA